MPAQERDTQATSALRNKLRQANRQGFAHHVELPPSDHLTVHQDRDVRTFLVVGIENDARFQSE